MPKSFTVEPGYLVRVGRCWYDERVSRMIVVEDETVDLFRRAAAADDPPRFIASYLYLDLNPDAPPADLHPFAAREAESLAHPIGKAKTA
jgi:hypothetical protein